MNEIFTNWNLIRVSGMLAFFWLTISIIFGMLSTFSMLKPKKSYLFTIHQSSGWGGLLTIVFHMIVLWQDQFVKYSLWEILVPFSAKNEPVFSAFGTIAFYLFLLVIFSSDFWMKKLGKKWWKMVHLSVLPAWLFMLLHGMLLGTDSGTTLANVIYIASITIMSSILLLRVFDYKIQRNKQTLAIPKKTPSI